MFGLKKHKLERIWRRILDNAPTDCIYYKAKRGDYCKLFGHLSPCVGKDNCIWYISKAENEQRLKVIHEAIRKMERDPQKFLEELKAKQSRERVDKIV